VFQNSLPFDQCLSWIKALLWLVPSGCERLTYNMDNHARSYLPSDVSNLVYYHVHRNSNLFLCIVSHLMVWTTLCFQDFQTQLDLSVTRCQIRCEGRGILGVDKVEDVVWKRDNYAISFVSIEPNPKSWCSTAYQKSQSQHCPADLVSPLFLAQSLAHPTCSSSMLIPAMWIPGTNYCELSRCAGDTASCVQFSHSEFQTHYSKRGSCRLHWCSRSGWEMGRSGSVGLTLPWGCLSWIRRSLWMVVTWWGYWRRWARLLSGYVSIVSLSLLSLPLNDVDFESLTFFLLFGLVRTVAEISVKPVRHFLFGWFD